MHKIHVIIKPDGTLLIIGVLNPHMPQAFADQNLERLNKAFGKTATVAIVPYATQVEVHDSSLWTALRRWWRGRKLQVKGSAQ
jgi:hypothetical protein